MSIRTVVWNEFVHEQENAVVQGIYPDGIHNTIAAAIAKDGDISVSTATLGEAEHGLAQERLDETDVLVWWGHKAHGEVSDEIVDRVQQRVNEGMGLIVLHSGHFSKIFKRMMGTPCSLRWREAGERERLWVINPSHPITQGIDKAIELPNSEMYGEPFLVPEPLETVFVSWFEGGEVFRSGLTYQRGAGKIFYFEPGHETYPIYHDPNIQMVLRNAVRWAYNPAPAWKDVSKAPNVPIDQARETIEKKGASLHKAGEAGYR
ncbi:MULTISPECIES: ThuA domain-containing protein [unclassified Aureimonas]|uniref:ThuA domain-containing protein n=1 Tax=unclassified Aureimonas TaxID=2615206 RepID=UPI0006FCD369|nr:MULTISPECIES: ThuA domain-containing protein [unclassified Aureimonas]KQT57492.1 glutamine amidotransferase [Aureimonas sp. Leaf427]KQT77172.1 glutamine amidotransferase [Aureimonas sp. Leaf460]